MKERKIFLGVFILMFLLLSVLPASADKSSVTLQAPTHATKGSEITVRLTITHSGNNFIHHVNWVEVWLNGQTAYRWEYSATNLPEAATFTKEIVMKIDRDTEVKAEANCNLHGSKGPAQAKILLKE